MNCYLGNEAYAFVSYAHQDKDKVLAFTEKLDQVGCRLWYDAGIEKTEEWINYLVTKIKNASLFIIFITKHINESKYIPREIYIASENNIPILPIYLDNISLPDHLAFSIGLYQAITYDELKDKNVFNKIPSSIKNMYGKSIYAYSNYEYYIFSDLSGFKINQVDKNGNMKTLFEKKYSEDYTAYLGLHSINPAIPYEFHDYKKSTLFFQIFIDLANKDIDKDLYLNYKFAIVDPNSIDAKLILEQEQSKKQSDN